MMRDFANWALETAKVRGATYADARVMDIRLRDLSTKNGQVGTLAESESYGIGIRVIAQGSWGFASTDRLTREGIAACAAEAVAIAKASALAKRHDVEMVPVEAYQDTWQNPYVKDPFQIPIERQLDLLLAADREMSRVKGVTVAETSMGFRRIEQFFASSLGSAIHQIKMQSGAGIVATAFAGNEIQKRSYPNSFGGQHHACRLRTGGIARSRGQRAAHRRGGRRAAFGGAIARGLEDDYSRQLAAWPADS